MSSLVWAVMRLTVVTMKNTGPNSLISWISLLATLNIKHLNTSLSDMLNCTGLQKRSIQSLLDAYWMKCSRALRCVHTRRRVSKHMWCTQHCRNAWWTLSDTSITITITITFMYSWIRQSLLLLNMVWISRIAQHWTEGVFRDWRSARLRRQFEFWDMMMM